MNTSSFIDEIQKSYTDTEIILEKADIYIDSIYRDYLINKESSDLKVLTESGTEDDLHFLYEEAGKTFSEKAKAVLHKIKITVSSFILKCTQKISSETRLEVFFHDLEKELKSNDRLRKEKIKIINLSKIEKAFNEAIDECHGIASKVKKDIEDSDNEEKEKLNKQANAVNDKFQKEKRDIEKWEEEVYLTQALYNLKDWMDLVKKEKFDSNIFIEIPEDVSTFSQKFLIKLDQMISQFYKEIWSVRMKAIHDTTSKIKAVSKTRGTDTKESVSIFDETDFYDSALESVFNDLQDGVYLDILESYGYFTKDSSEDVEIYSEAGTGMDPKKYFRKFSREYKTQMKVLKKAIHKKDYKEANKSMRSIKRSLKLGKSFLNSSKSDTLPSVCGLMSMWINGLKNDLEICITSFIGHELKTIDKLAEKTQKQLDDITIKCMDSENINGCKSNLVSCLDRCGKVLDDLTAILQTVAKMK